MLKKGDKIVYGTLGVMQITDIRKETVLGVTRDYYVLSELGTDAASLTYVPCDNDKLVSTMRPILSKKEIMELVKGAKDLPKAEWQSDNRQRSETFKKIIAEADRAGLIGLIKAIYEEQRQRKSEGKKIYLADENAMRKAEKILYSEFSAVLGIPKEEVPAFIAKHCE